MANSQDTAPLFTVMGPVGWMFAAFSWFAGLGKSHEKERQKLFADHRARNEARGWKRGDNILRALGTGEMEARRSAAERAIQQVNDIIGTLPRAPWLQRKKFGKSGGLYTVKDVRNNVVRQSQAASNAKIKGRLEEKARQARVRMQQRTRDTGTFSRRGIRTTSGGLGSATGYLIDTLQTEAIRRLLLRQRVERLSNRRGDLAHDPLRPRGRTGRTAAGDSGRSGAVSGSGGSTVTQPGTTNKPGNVATQPEHASSGSVGESSASREARRVLESSKSLPKVVTATRTPSLLAQASQLGVASVLGSAFNSKPSTRLTSTRLTSTRTRLADQDESPLSLGTSLTPLNIAGVQSASQQACKCPPEKKTKKRKDGKPRCTNPVISRTTRDGIRTTKVRLECQPSKPKFP